MIKYAKVIDNELGLCEVGVGTNADFYKSIGMSQMDVEISEKDNQWYLSEKCPHYTSEEKEEQEKQQLILEIKQQLNNLDLKSIRALRSNDTEYIELYEQQAVELRNRLKELQRKEDEE